VHWDVPVFLNRWFHSKTWTEWHEYLSLLSHLHFTLKFTSYTTFVNLIFFIVVWLRCTPSMGKGTHMREWNLSLYRSEWHCTLLSMDPKFISIDPAAKSMIDTKYEQECLKFSFYFLCRWKLMWAVWYLNCVSRLYVAWFFHFALTFWLIFSFIRMPTRNRNCSMMRSSTLLKGHIRQKRRTLQIAARNLWTAIAYQYLMIWIP